VAAAQAKGGRLIRPSHFQDPGVDESTQYSIQSLDVDTDLLAHEPPFRDPFESVHGTWMLGEIRADGLGHLVLALVIHCAPGAQRVQGASRSKMVS
jgi:hypothetical protein